MDLKDRRLWYGVVSVIVSAQTLPVDHLDRHGLQTDIVEQPRI
ncbi:hypothetical protein [Mesorhizobium sp. M0166]